jgi:multicomponent Na+:H+ antiporter subunit E
VLALSVFWFSLSGETSPLFLFLFLVSLLVTLWLSARLEVIDRDASPYHRIPNLVLYLPWLGVEVVKSNVAVLRAVVSPGRISPGFLRVPSGCKSDLARTVFANSITLTPGTVTVDIEDGVFVVHALEAKGLEPEAFARMEARATAAADGWS